MKNLAILIMKYQDREHYLNNCKKKWKIAQIIIIPVNAYTNNLEI